MSAICRPKLERASISRAAVEVEGRELVGAGGEEHRPAVGPESGDRGLDRRGVVGDAIADRAVGGVPDVDHQPRRRAEIVAGDLGRARARPAVDDRQVGARPIGPVDRRERCQGAEAERGALRRRVSVVDERPARRREVGQGRGP
jgi:hypothetical protein